MTVNKNIEEYKNRLRYLTNEKLTNFFASVPALETTDENLELLRAIGREAIKQTDEEFGVEVQDIDVRMNFTENNELNVEFFDLTPVIPVEENTNG
jgi:hypothetical protein